MLVWKAFFFSFVLLILFAEAGGYCGESCSSCADYYACHRFGDHSCAWDYNEGRCFNRSMECGGKDCYSCQVSETCIKKKDCSWNPLYSHCRNLSVSVDVLCEDYSGELLQYCDHSPFCHQVNQVCTKDSCLEMDRVVDINGFSCPAGCSDTLIAVDGESTNVCLNSSRKLDACFDIQLKTDLSRLVCPRPCHVHSVTVPDLREIYACVDFAASDDNDDKLICNGIPCTTCPYSVGCELQCVWDSASFTCYDPNTTCGGDTCATCTSERACLDLPDYSCGWRDSVCYNATTECVNHCYSCLHPNTCTAFSSECVFLSHWNGCLNITELKEEEEDCSFLYCEMECADFSGEWLQYCEHYSFCIQDGQRCVEDPCLEEEYPACAGGNNECRSYLFPSLVENGTAVPGCVSANRTIDTCFDLHTKHSKVRCPSGDGCETVNLTIVAAPANITLYGCMNNTDNGGDGENNTENNTGNSSDNTGNDSNNSNSSSGTPGGHSMLLIYVIVGTIVVLAAVAVAIVTGAIVVCARRNKRTTTKKR